MAADAYAHAIRPTHTTNDGDTIYTLASGKLGAGSKRRRSPRLTGYARRKGPTDRHRKRSQNRQNLPRHPRRREVA